MSVREIAQGRGKTVIRKFWGQRQGVHPRKTRKRACGDRGAEGGGGTGLGAGGGGGGAGGGGGGVGGGGGSRGKTRAGGGGACHNTSKP